MRTDDLLKLIVHHRELNLLRNALFAEIVKTPTQNYHIISWSILITNLAWMIWVLELKYEVFSWQIVYFFKSFFPGNNFSHFKLILLKELIFKDLIPCVNTRVISAKWLCETLNNFRKMVGVERAKKPEGRRSMTRISQMQDQVNLKWRQIVYFNLSIPILHQNLLLNLL